MALFPSSNTILDVTNKDTQISTTHLRSIKFSSLKAGTVHDLYIDGILNNWAARPWGGDLGDSLISDSQGILQFDVLLEFYYSGSYSYDTTMQHMNLISNKNAENNEISYHKTSKLIEVKAPGSRGYINIPVRILVTAGDPNSIDSHSH